MRWRRDTEPLTSHLETLPERLGNDTDRPQPVVRRLIPKSHGTRRPVGLPALEDQSVATAVARLLAASDAQDFSDCSPGFRPGRSPQQARHAVRQGLLGSRRGSGIACDLSAFFDTGQPNTLWAMRRPRINAGRRLERIEKWRHAGILDGKERVYPEKGSPQGSVISPLRANGYLPEVLDTWGETVVQAHCRGPVALSRYADDGAPRTHERRLNHDRMR